MAELPEINAESPNRTSLYLALLAILISLVGTGVSIFESKLLREQQDLMVEEKAASVWPYVDLVVSSKNKGMFGGFYNVSVQNKGIGPALMGPAEFTVAGETVGIDDLPAAMSRQYPGIEMTTGLSQSRKVENVLSAEESTTLTGYQLKVDTSRWRQDIPVDSLIEISLCYCSVYGDCWTVDGKSKPKKTENCPARLDLR